MIMTIHLSGEFTRFYYRLCSERLCTPCMKYLASFHSPRLALADGRRWVCSVRQNEGKTTLKHSLNWRQPKATKLDIPFEFVQENESHSTLCVSRVQFISGTAFPAQIATNIPTCFSELVPGSHVQCQSQEFNLVSKLVFLKNISCSKCSKMFVRKNDKMMVKPKRNQGVDLACRSFE